MCVGPGHMVVYGNPAFVSSFGAHCLGMPAREVMIGVPSTAFAVFDARADARAAPSPRWVRLGDEDWRVTVKPRLDPETGEPYGVAFHLRARSDMPGRAEPAPATDRPRRHGRRVRRRLRGPGRGWYTSPVPSTPGGPARHRPTTRTPGPLDSLPRPLSERGRRRVRVG